MKKRNKLLKKIIKFISIYKKGFYLNIIYNMISKLDISDSKIAPNQNISSNLLYENNNFNKNSNINEIEKNILSYLFLRANLSYSLTNNSYNINSNLNLIPQNTNFNLLGYNDNIFYKNPKINLYNIMGINNEQVKKNIKKKKIQNKIKEKENKENIIKMNIKSHNIINISLLISGEEKRTFVRLHPIPTKLSVFDMVRIIDKYLKTKPGKRIYNAIYLPLTKKIGKNMGYCFINLVSPKYVLEFYNIFNGFYFRFKNFKKSCYVVFSDIQEIDTSIDDPTRRPMIFYDTIKEDKEE